MGSISLWQNRISVMNNHSMAIQWRLRHIMADRKITGKELAKRINRHPTSVSLLRNSDTMPRLDAELLESLCKALNCTPSDLIEYKPEGAA